MVPEVTVSRWAWSAMQTLWNSYVQGWAWVCAFGFAFVDGGVSTADGCCELCTKRHLFGLFMNMHKSWFDLDIAGSQSQRQWRTAQQQLHNLTCRTDVLQEARTGTRHPRLYPSDYKALSYTNPTKSSELQVSISESNETQHESYASLVDDWYTFICIYTYMC
jgi:hypothetical protein